MLQVINRTAVYQAKISAVMSRILQSDNMPLHDFEDCMRTIHMSRFKISVINNEKAQYAKNDML